MIDPGERRSRAGGLRTAPAAVPVLVTALACALLAWGCGGGGMDDVEFARHLRLARDAMRRGLAESAEAELARCAESRPDNAEVLFQRARLATLPRAGGGPDDASRARAHALYERVLEVDPRHLGALRASLLLGTDGDARDALRLRVSRAHGALGEHEVDLALDYERSIAPPPIRLPAISGAGLGAAEYLDMVGGLRALQRTGRYDPVAAVTSLEALLRAQPDLAAVRHQYAFALDTFEVRIPGRAASEAGVAASASLPPISSRLTLALCEKHYSDAYDRVPPGSGVAWACLRGLGEVALKMGEWNDAYERFELALADPRPDPAQHAHMRLRQVLARHKQGRDVEALALFREHLADPPGGADPSPRALWTLHLVQEALGLPAEEREPAFRFAPEIELPRMGDEPAFVDAAPRLGVDKLDGLGPSAWGDFDLDGDDDLFLCGCDSYGMLLRKRADLRFADVSADVGLGDVQSGYSATLADADGDGWLDLYIGRDGWNGAAPNSFYRNTDGRFTDETDAAGVGDGGASFVHLWSDVDRDGDLDLFVANGITGGGDVNRLYQNDGAARFADATSRMGLFEQRGTRTIGVAAGDYDLDGWPDLFCSGYLTVNRLYHNRGTVEAGVERFEEVAAKAGVQDPDNVTNGYVAFFADLDEDGDLDLLRTSLAPFDEVLADLGAGRGPGDDDVNSLRLYRNEGDGTFRDRTAEAGLLRRIGVMGAGVADLDNDGRLDLYLGTGDPDLGRLEPDRFLHNRAEGFVDRTFALGLGHVGKGHGVTFVDVDLDGDLDVYAQEGGFVHGDSWRNALFENRSFAAGRRWIAIELVGSDSNREGVDAKILVTAGGRTMLRERRNGEGFGCSNTPAVEFGLGSAESIERVEIRWPSGAVQAFEDAPIDARIRVREGGGWEELE